MGSAVGAPAANFQVVQMRTCPLCRRRPADCLRFPSRRDMTDSSDVSLQPLSALREFAPRNRRERQREDGATTTGEIPSNRKKIEIE